MSHRRRMYRTLAALAAAMTSTAALLAYIDPSGTLIHQPLSPEELAGLARSLVTDDVVLAADRWRRIEIVPVYPPFGAGTALTATAPEDDAHFVIDAYGRPSRGGRWGLHTPSGSRSDAIRIRVTLGDAEPALTVAQRDSANALLTAIKEQVGGGTHVAVLIPPTTQTQLR